MTTEDEFKLLGSLITPENKNILQFKMEDSLPLSTEISAMIATKKSEQITVLSAKTYPTTITDQYIDIVIIKDK